MFEHEIILKGTNILAVNAKKMIKSHNTLLLYGKGDIVYYQSTYKIKQDYPFEDDGGKYRVVKRVIGNSRVTERWLALEAKGSDLVYREGNNFCKKMYESDKDKTRPYIDVWDLNLVGKNYPTEKPYKLLERIICLSTKSSSQ